MNRHLTPTALHEISAHLRRGGVIAYPTESCFGLGVLPNHTQALSRLLRLKKRPAGKGFIVIGARLTQFKPYIAPLSTAEISYLNTVWPAAKTFLVPAKKTTSPWLRGKGHKKLALRIPDHEGARALCNDLGSALVSTSANRTGKRVLKTAKDVRRQFRHDVMIIPGRIGSYATSSQIFDLTSHKRYR